MNTPVSTTDTNLALAREYLDRVFNAHRPELAAEYFTPNVKWHGGTLGTIEGPDNVVALLDAIRERVGVVKSGPQPCAS